MSVPLFEEEKLVGSEQSTQGVELLSTCINIEGAFFFEMPIPIFLNSLSRRELIFLKKKIIYDSSGVRPKKSYKPMFYNSFLTKLFPLCLWFWTAEKGMENDG